MKDYGTDLFIIILLLGSILAAVLHVEKAINNQSNMFAHAMTGQDK